jgi:hypothetical protein
MVPAYSMDLRSRALKDADAGLSSKVLAEPAQSFSSFLPASSSSESR